MPSFYQRWAELSEPGEHKTTNDSRRPSPALRRRRRGEAAPSESGEAAPWLVVTGYIGREKSTTPFGLYPASRVSGRGPAGLGKSKLLLDDHNGLLAGRSGQRAEAAVAELDLLAMNLPTVSSGVPNFA